MKTVLYVLLAMILFPFALPFIAVTLTIVYLFFGPFAIVVGGITAVVLANRFIVRPRLLRSRARLDALDTDLHAGRNVHGRGDFPVAGR